MTENASYAMPPEVVAFATRMFDAARHGDTAIFAQALPAGLSANLTNDKGDSLIMLAAYHGHAQLVSLLLSYDANPNSLNDRGQSPLAGAVFKHEADVIEALLAGGADPQKGEPSATEALVIFKQEDTWGQKFQQAPGRGKGGVIVNGGVSDPHRQRDGEAHTLNGNGSP